MSVSYECCVLWGRGLCAGVIAQSDNSYRVWCVWVWSRNPVRGGPDPESGWSATGKKNILPDVISVTKRKAGWLRSALTSTPILHIVITDHGKVRSTVNLDDWLTVHRQFPTWCTKFFIYLYTVRLLTHCGRVTQICVFDTVNLGTSASSP